MLPTRWRLSRSTRAKVEAGGKVCAEQRAPGAQLRESVRPKSLAGRMGTHGGRHPHSRHDPPASGPAVPESGSPQRTNSPCPPSLFPCFEEAPTPCIRTATSNCKRTVSVPPEYVGRQVWVRWEAKLVRVFNHRHEQVAVHVRTEPGKFATDPQHLHSPYRRVVQQSLDYLLDRARSIGKHTGSWAEAMTRQRGPAGMRVLHGLLSLAGKHPAAALERATEKALHHGTWRLRDLRTLLEQAGLAAPQLWTFWKPQSHDPATRCLCSDAGLF